MDNRKIKIRCDYEKIDVRLSALLVIQAFTIFIAIPLGAGRSSAHVLLDVCHLSFAVVCVLTFTRQRRLQAGLLASLALGVLGPMAGRHIFTGAQIAGGEGHEFIALIAFAFTSAVTFIVLRHIFGPGRVTAHRVQGAVLVYLNVAALFSIVYGIILAHAPDAIKLASGTSIQLTSGVQASALSYFSLSTLTTTGYGDIVPVHPFVRGLANLESVIGQLFPATLLARIVALHVAHSNDNSDGREPA